MIVIIIGGMSFASDYKLINGKSIKAVVSMQIQNQKQTECSWFILENHYHSVSQELFFGFDSMPWLLSFSHMFLSL